MSDKLTEQEREAIEIRAGGVNPEERSAFWLGYRAAMDHSKTRAYIPEPIKDKDKREGSLQAAFIEGVLHGRNPAPSPAEVEAAAAALYEIDTVADAMIEVLIDRHAVMPPDGQTEREMRRKDMKLALAAACVAAKVSTNPTYDDNIKKENKEQNYEKI